MTETDSVICPGSPMTPILSCNQKQSATNEATPVCVRVRIEWEQLDANPPPSASLMELELIGLRLAWPH